MTSEGSDVAAPDVTRRRAMQVLGAIAVTGTVPERTGADPDGSDPPAESTPEPEWVASHADGHEKQETREIHSRQLTGQRTYTSYTRNGNLLTYKGADYVESEGQWVHKFVITGVTASVLRTTERGRNNQGEEVFSEDFFPCRFVKGTSFNVTHSGSEDLTLAAQHRPNEYMFFHPEEFTEQIANNDEGFRDAVVDGFEDGRDPVDHPLASADEVAANIQELENQRHSLGEMKFIVGATATAIGVIGVPGAAAIGFISFLFGLYDPYRDHKEPENDWQDLYYFLPYYEREPDRDSLPAGGGHSVEFHAKVDPSTSAQFTVSSSFEIVEGQEYDEPEAWDSRDPYWPTKDDAGGNEFLASPEWSVQLAPLPEPESPGNSRTRSGALAVPAHDDMEGFEDDRWYVNVEPGETLRPGSSGVTIGGRVNMDYDWYFEREYDSDDLPYILREDFSWVLTQDGDSISVRRGHGFSHAITEPGQYRLDLRLDGAGVVAQRHFSVAEQVSVSPDASLPERIPAGEQFVLDASGSTATNAVDRYQWELEYAGSGGTETDTIVTTDPTTPFVLEEAGTWDVTLTVVDTEGYSATTPARLEVVSNESDEESGDGEGIHAAITVMESDPAAGEEVWFSAAGSTSRHGYIANYDWAFGDDKDDECTVSSIDHAQDSAPRCATKAHTYAEAGKYTVSLEVSDSVGNVATATTEVSVGEPGEGSAEGGGGSSDDESEGSGRGDGESGRGDGGDSDGSGGRYGDDDGATRYDEDDPDGYDYGGDSDGDAGSGGDGGSDRGGAKRGEESGESHESRDGRDGSSDGGGRRDTGGGDGGENDDGSRRGSGGRGRSGGSGDGGGSDGSGGRERSGGSSGNGGSGASAGSGGGDDLYDDIVDDPIDTIEERTDEARDAAEEGAERVVDSIDDTAGRFRDTVSDAVGTLARWF